MNFHIYTDGSCKGNPGKGGYAYDVYDDLDEVWVRSRGSEEETTNNRMELTAAIESLRMVDKSYTNYTATIYSDSAYLVNCFNENWIENWKENGWKTHKKQDVLNKDLWQILDLLVKKTGISFKKVPRNDPKIQRVDKEAKSAARS